MKLIPSIFVYRSLILGEYKKQDKLLLYEESSILLEGYMNRKKKDALCMKFRALLLFFSWKGKCNFVFMEVHMWEHRTNFIVFNAQIVGNYHWLSYYGIQLMIVWIMYFFFSFLEQIHKIEIYCLSEDNKCS